MTMRSGKVKARLECRRCGYAADVCVPVRRGVPPWAECDHPLHGPAARDGGGDLMCRQCRRHWGLDGEDLTRILEDLLGRDLGDSRSLGAVRVPCPPR